MLALIVGLILGTLVGAVTGAVVASFWRLARWGRIGAPLFAGFAGFCADGLLQLLGAGQLGFVPGLGLIDWRPVASTVIACALVGVLAATCLAFLRYGSRPLSRIFR